jgi:hypothetical protein
MPIVSVPGIGCNARIMICAMPDVTMATTDQQRFDRFHVACECRE